MLKKDFSTRNKQNTSMLFYAMACLVLINCSQILSDDKTEMMLVSKVSNEVFIISDVSRFYWQVQCYQRNIPFDIYDGGVGSMLHNLHNPPEIW